MIVVSSSTIAGKKITETIGMATGSTIRARHLGKDIIAGLKNLVGGEIEEYTKLMAEAREQALDRMVDHAQTLGANAIVDAQFTTSYLQGAASEVLVFGTAVKVEDE